MKFGHSCRSPIYAVVGTEFHAYRIELYVGKVYPGTFGYPQILGFCTGDII